GTAGANDSVIPGSVQNLSVTGSNGDFKATWSDPATGNFTIDDTAIQYCTDSGFTANGPGSPSLGWGNVNLLKSTDPNKSYYFRVALHNQSGIASHTSTGTSGPSFLGATGWGPWTAYGSPTLVSSNPIPLTPAQTDDGVAFNGNFEIDADGDGFPDGWLLVGGGAPATGALGSPAREGKYLFIIDNHVTGQAGYYSPAFP